MDNNNPYHDGELTVQERVNEVDIARMNGRVISNSIPEGAIHFIEQQSMLVLGSLDINGDVWCSAIFGESGFIKAKDTHTLELNLKKAGFLKTDPLWKNLNSNVNVGLIIIELGSRRRLRINGRLRKIKMDYYIIDVEQAYPNCPKYIQRHHINKAKKLLRANDEESLYGTELKEAQKKFISNADTFFVASANTNFNVDASHRGGQPGFIQILNDKLLRIPDYSGNSMFNTLGNFQNYPHAGLIFIDFKNKRLLQLSGTPEIIWQLDDPDRETGGTQRYWQFEINTWQESHIPFDIDWELLDTSPFNPIPSKQKKNIEHSLSLKVEKIVQETPLVKSFVLRSENMETLPAFQPGAHLKIKVKTPGNKESERHYSLLSSPDDKSHYEIGVQLDSNSSGGSLYLHNELSEGDILISETPNNNFPMIKQAKHTIMIAGGIGITPFLSMIHRLVSLNQSYEIHYTARNQSELAFSDRIQKIAGDKLSLYTSGNKTGTRLDLPQLLSSPSEGTHVYVCGPRRMISSVRDTAAENSWLSSQIHYESFGARLTNDERPIRIHLTKSDKIITVPTDRTILDTLLDEGLDIPHECKRGECSLCATRVLDGEPEHRDLCLNKEERSTSMCVCVSRAKGNELKLEL